MPPQGFRTMFTSSSTDVCRTAQLPVASCSCMLRNTILVCGDSRATRSSAWGAGSSNAPASATRTSGRNSKSLRRHSAALPASLTTSMSASSCNKRRRPCRNKTWSCTSKQRIFLPAKVTSLRSVRGGTQFLPCLIRDSAQRRRRVGRRKTSKQCECQLHCSNHLRSCAGKKPSENDFFLRLVRGRNFFFLRKLRR
jgi:hypothetical protein